MSDEIYHQQVVDENRTSRLDVSMNGLEETEALATLSLDTEVIHKSDSKKAMAAAKQLLAQWQTDSNPATALPFSTFFQGLSTRRIAQMESVRQQSVWDSLYWASKKLKNFFK